MKSKNQIYRVECNFGSKYFADLDKAKKYFNKKANNRLNVELWQITIPNKRFSKKSNIYAMQILLHCTTPVVLDI